MNDEKKITLLLISFFEEENQWEVLSSDSNKSTEENNFIIEAIFNKYCTSKKRNLGGFKDRSYGYDGSYRYNPKEETIVSIEIEDKKAIVNTYREKPIAERNKYIVKKTKNGWLIDSKKRFSNWKGVWENDIL